MKFSVAFIAGIAAFASAAPASTHVVHEKREIDTARWVQSDFKLDRRAVIPMSVGLKQRNLENGYDYLMDVSDPKSRNYGKHWDSRKIIETFRPSAESIDEVKSWLSDSGISSDRVKLSQGYNWLKFDVSIEEAESLLKTEYNVFDHAMTGQQHIGCNEYSIPAHIQEHVDFISPTISFDAKVVSPKKKRSLSRRGSNMTSSAKNNVNNVAWNPKKGATFNAAQAALTNFSLANCDTYITPDCLRALYNLPNGTLNDSSLAVVEYTPQAYLQSDLDLFYANLQRQIPSGYGPIVDLIDGADVQNTTQSFNDNGESDLDVEYAIALAYPQSVTLYQTGDEVEGASFNNFLDAIDASYCTYDGGDDPTEDGIYPDTATGGYSGPEDCGIFAPASVISTSYGYDEAELTAAYEQRQCYEYMKLGLAGVTILYSSGDYGVAGNGGYCCLLAGCAGGILNPGNSGTFNPSFPGTCPYVTSVGATQVITGATVTAAESASETVIYSGGGFSNVFPLPDYQSDAVAAYFADYEPDYTATQYNNSQTVRGFPDVSANGANYVVAVDGELSLVYGTSASSPTFAAIISLINNERIKAGKSVVGFLNPTMYANPDAFNDITTGGNEGCGTDGFTSVPGWDPVTGLGTPDYVKLLEVFMALD